MYGDIDLSKMERRKISREGSSYDFSNLLHQVRKIVILLGKMFMRYPLLKISFHSQDQR